MANINEALEAGVLQAYVEGERLGLRQGTRMPSKRIMAGTILQLVIRGLRVGQPSGRVSY